MKALFKVGDKVTISNEGKLYSSYEEMAKAMGLRQWLPGNYASAYASQVGTVVAVREHLSDRLILCGVQYADGNTLILGEGGLTAADEETLSYTEFWDALNNAIESYEAGRRVRMSVAQRRRENYRINKIRLMKQANRAFPTKYMQIETEAESVSYIEDVYMHKGEDGKSRRIVRYSTYYNERPTTTNETTMDNFMRSRRFKYISE